MAQSTLWSNLIAAAPSLCATVDGLVTDWVKPILLRLQQADGVPKYPKTLNDAVWGTVELLPCEVLLLDSPLLQRLRGVRQLGMAHLVYPGAGHDRLEHSLGALEAAQQILAALERNARNRRKYSGQPDRAIPEPSDRDRAATRLGALLHDVGHAPFSHATEHLIAVQYPDEFEAANGVLRRAFPDVTSIDPAEQMAVLIVLSEALRAVLEHVRFEVGSTKDGLAEAAAARILGSREYLNATYLSGVVSGPLDADKVDYMARDSHHAGLPLGLDITRLVSKLEVVEVTTENALNQELKDRASLSGGRFYDLGLSRAGLGAFEQMVMARVTLYERLYYHQKIRAAEGMVRNLVEALKERGAPVALSELYSGFGDDAMIQLWGGMLTCGSIISGGVESASVARRLRERDLLHRAFSFSSRFINIDQGLPEKERDDIRAVFWSGVTGAVEDYVGAREVADAIWEKAIQISEALSRFAAIGSGLSKSDIVVDLPKHSRVSKGTDILIASEAGHIGTPNLFFNAEKWALAYSHQKQCGYVFAPRGALQLVALASRVVFYERFGVAMGPDADVAAKTHGLIDPALCDEVRKAGLCGAECLAVLRDAKPQLLRMRPEHLRIPPSLVLEDTQLPTRIAREFAEAVPGGLPATFHNGVIEALEGMLKALQVIEQSGDFVGSGRPDEKKDLQAKLCTCLRAAGLTVVEGEEVAGGKTDLVLNGGIVLENKVLEEVEDPFAKLGPASWQVRRYSIAVSQRVRFICAAYKPASEESMPPLSQRIKIRSAAGRKDDAAEVLFVIPYGHDVPSRAARQAPKQPS